MKSGPAIVILSLLLGGCSVLRDVIPSASKERKCKGVLGCGSFEELQHKFTHPARVGVYVLAFVFLALHLLHGFQSAFQSVGFRHNKYTPIIKKLGTIYAIVIPLGFI